MSGFLASALIGLAALLPGLLIIHLTPPNDRTAKPKQ